jgi:hypothetical protein
MSLTTAIGFRASNLDEALKLGALAIYSEQDWISLFSQLGKITVIDMILGNHDRIIHMNPTSHKIAPNWNLANIMLDVKERKFFAIDNGISTSLLPKEKEVDLCFYPNQEENSLVEDIPTVAPTSQLEVLHQHFKSFLQNCVEKPSLESLASDVVKSFFDGSEAKYPNLASIAPICIHAWKQSLLETLCTLKKDNSVISQNILSVFQTHTQGNIAFRNELLKVILQNLVSLSNTHVER